MNSNDGSLSCDPDNSWRLQVPEPASMKYVSEDCTDVGGTELWGSASHSNIKILQRF